MSLGKNPEKPYFISHAPFEMTGSEILENSFRSLAKLSISMRPTFNQKRFMAFDATFDLEIIYLQVIQRDIFHN